MNPACNITCSLGGCTKKATLCCECTKSSVFMCVGHLSMHTSNPGLHNPIKLQDSVLHISKPPARASNTFVKCDSKQCQGLAKFFCNCTQASICVNCLDSHILANCRITHPIEVRYIPRSNFEDTMHPLNMFLERTQCDSYTINKIKTKNITMKEILGWDVKKLNNMSEALGFSSTIKYLLWQEINYIRIVTEKTCFKNDNTSKLVFGLKENEESEVMNEENKRE